MKRITIYNDRGGCGKTSLTAMLATYMSREGRSVLVLDLDGSPYGIKAMREQEIETLKDPGSVLSRMTEGKPVEAYPIRAVNPEDGGLAEKVRDICGEGIDFLIYDLPGGLSPDSPLPRLCSAGLLDAAVVPMDTDPWTMKAAMVTADALGRCGVRTSLLWNRIYLDEMTGSRYTNAQKVFESKGMTVLPKKMALYRNMTRDSSEEQFIRSTVLYPEKTIRSKCNTVHSCLNTLMKFFEEQ